MSYTQRRTHIPYAPMCQAGVTLVLCTGTFRYIRRDSFAALRPELQTTSTALTAYVASGESDPTDFATLKVRALQHL